MPVFRGFKVHSDENETLVYSQLHAHCETCYNRKCSLTPDDLSSCLMLDCRYHCGQRFHHCKQEDHELICQSVKVPCLNSTYGCTMLLPRGKLGCHLTKCPASIIRCVIEWNRWPMHSAIDSVKAPLPLDNPHVRCGQLDVALALRDQQILQESMKTPRRIRKIFQNSITLKYPSVPLEAPGQNSSEDQAINNSLNNSDDETDAPWEVSKYPPGLKKSVIRSIYKASQETSESLTSALDFVSSHFGKTASLQKIKEIKEPSEGDHTQTDSTETTVDSHIISDARISDNSVRDTTCKSKSVTNNAELLVCSDDASRDNAVSKLCDSLDSIYDKKIKLHELLGVSLNIECISKYQPKPIKMFTFLCAQNFRRDEYQWHFKNVHNDIHCGLNGFLEQRCPLAEQGCDYTYQKMSPKLPRGQIVHSGLLGSFGLVTSNDEQEKNEVCDTSRSSDEANCDDAIKRKLREATPEIVTSRKYDSCIKIYPRYRRCSGYNNGTHTSYDDQEQLLLTKLPFEVLQHIAKFLDAFSMCNLSLSCRILRYVCCSLLEQKGMVDLQWEATKSSKGISWQVSGRRWSFSTAFTPVREWDYHCSSSLFDHLKTCPYNQDKDKIIRTDAYQLKELGVLEVHGKKIKGTRGRRLDIEDEIQCNIYEDQDNGDTNSESSDIAG